MQKAVQLRLSDRMGSFNALYIAILAYFTAFRTLEEAMGRWFNVRRWAKGKRAGSACMRRGEELMLWW